MEKREKFYFDYYGLSVIATISAASSTSQIRYRVALEVTNEAIGLVEPARPKDLAPLVAGCCFKYLAQDKVQSMARDLELPRGHYRGDGEIKRGLTAQHLSNSNGRMH